MSDCVDVVVEEAVTDPKNAYILIVTAVCSLIVGLVLGIVFLACFRRFCRTKWQSCTGYCTPKQYIKEENILLTTYKNNGQSEEIRYSENVSRINEGGRRESVKENHTQVSLLGALITATWDGIIVEMGRQELYELDKIEMMFWEERHTCLMQVYRSVLNKHFKAGQIDESQYTKILEEVDKRLSAALSDFTNVLGEKRFFGSKVKKESLIDQFKSEQDRYFIALNEIMLNYQRISSFFMDAVSLHVEEEYIKQINDTVVSSWSEIETMLSKHQENLTESLHYTFLKYRLVAQQFITASITETTTHLSSLNSYEVILGRLVKTGQISTETKEILRKLTQDSNEEVFDITAEFVQEFKDLLPSVTSNSDGRINRFDQETLTTLQILLGEHQNDTNMNEFIPEYLQTCFNLQKSKQSLLQSIAEKEAYEIGNIMRKISDEKRHERSEKTKLFCDEICRHDALSEPDAQQMFEELLKKCEATHESTFLTVQSNITSVWTQYEQHCLHLQKEENLVRSTIIKDSAADDFTFLTSILEIQRWMSEEDKNLVIQNMRSLVLLLNNQTRFCHLKWDLVMENDLAKCQAFLLKKQAKRLTSKNINETIEIVKRLWEEKNVMQDYLRERIPISITSSVFATSKQMQAGLISEIFISKHHTKEIAAQNSTSHFDEALKSLMEFLGTQISKKEEGYAGKLADEHKKRFINVLKEEQNRKSMETSLLEEELGTVYSKLQSRMSMKAQRIRPNMEVHEDVTTFLEQTLLRYQIGRALNDVDMKSQQQLQIERKPIEISMMESINKLLDDSKVSLVCKFAALANISKGELVKLVEKVMHEKYRGGREINAAKRKFVKLWKSALSTVDNTVDQQK